MGLEIWRSRHAPAAARPATTSDLEKARAGPHLYFVSALPASFGRVAVAPIDDPKAPPAITALQCNRVYFAHGHGLCLVDNRAKVHPPAIAAGFDADFHVLHTFDLGGAPSRARVSADGRYGAATVFTTGDSYATAFSTRTTIFDLDAGSPVGDLEQFGFSRDGRPFREVDFNVWGVTFAPDSDRFYATLSSKGRPYLVEGSVSARSAHVIAEDVECPSVSPDGTRVVFKRRMKETGMWRLHAMDLATKNTWPLAEQRNVDDQVEWLDGDRVLYGIVAERGTPDEAMNVWVVSVSPDAGAPEIFAKSASSPAAVR